MAPSKAPGVDGFTAGFFQRHWSLLKGDICAAVWEFLEGVVTPEEFNDTIIVMIPKVSSPELLPQYRPISLFN